MADQDDAALTAFLAEYRFDRPHRHLWHQTAVGMKQPFVLEDLREYLRRLHGTDERAGEHQVDSWHVLCQRGEVRGQDLPAFHGQRPRFVSQAFRYLRVSVPMSNQENLQVSSPTRESPGVAVVHEAGASGQR